MALTAQTRRASETDAPAALAGPVWEPGGERAAPNDAGSFVVGERQRGGCSGERPDGAYAFHFGILAFWHFEIDPRVHR